MRIYDDCPAILIRNYIVTAARLLKHTRFVQALTRISHRNLLRSPKALNLRAPQQTASMPTSPCGQCTVNLQCLRRPRYDPCEKCGLS
jgi:hypothetical protein